MLFRSYRFGPKVSEDPRLTPKHTDAVLEAVGLKDDKNEKYLHLSQADRVAVRCAIGRKSAAFWIEGEPRTTLRAYKHDVVTSGPPVRGHPIRLKGDEALFVKGSLQGDIDNGLYKLGSSAWGSWAFSTRPTVERRRRVVVDYRRVNAALRKAIYFIRRCEDVKQELAGSLFYTTVDGLKGFNLLENTDYASKVLAVLSDLGCLLAKVLQLGPCNGPFDFQ